LNPRLWRFVEYGKRNLLPAIAGVYCVMSSGGSLLYIGQSVNINQRWKGHHLRQQLKAGASLHIAYRETFSEVGRLKMEAILIRQHQPRLNANLLPRLPKPAVTGTPLTGHELKERRSKLGLSQEEMARSLDVALSTVARWEQLKDDEIPNAGMLQLALESLESKAKKVVTRK
jgi:DNA-binding transcriptional regulator YiaG